MQMETFKIKSLAKSIQVLECFLNETELGVTQISERLGLYKSNVHDILSTFEQLGYVSKNDVTNRYCLTLKMLSFSHTITNAMGFRKTVYPHMQQLASELNETIYLGVFEGNEVVYLDVAYPQNVPTTRAMLGDRAPLYCTGLGKAILSFMRPEQVAEGMPTEFVPYTANTISSEQAMRQEMVTIHERGYSIDDMEHEFGIKCVAVPILDSSGHAVAALSASGPSLRFDQESIPYYAKKLKRTSKQIQGFF